MWRRPTFKYLKQYSTSLYGNNVQYCLFQVFRSAGIAQAPAETGQG